ncbi:MAG: BrnA antitoxin family protein [Zoogloeaceae bacterium]|jgi:uncharacterized protein (DUF4415 family)|nr:BrnA antitoxin family protein [Zoogloeaceae bacterium]
MSNTSELFLKTRDGRLIRLNTPEEEEAIQRGIAADPDAREWTDEDFARARPARETLVALKNKGGRPKSATPKVQTAIRFDADVLARLKATGKGWQTRVNDAMREWLSAHSA